jgi:hypothetical protein
MSKGPRQDKSRPAQRFRRSLPTQRVRPAVASVLEDAVLLAKGEVDRMKVAAAKAPLTGGDIGRLEQLVNTLDRAQRLEARIEEQLRGELSGLDDEQLAEVADGGEGERK